MPAITADTLTLPRVPDIDPTAVDRPVRSITTGPTGFEGEGFPVRRAFAGATYADIDPFIMMDQMGEVNYAPFEARGTDWHPHRGFETVTIVYDGEVEHRDSTGAGGVITDWNGRPLTLESETSARGEAIAAGDARVHATAVTMLQASA